MADYKGKMPVRNNAIYQVTDNEEPSSSAVVASQRSASQGVSTLDKFVTYVAGDEDKIAMDCALSLGDGSSVSADNPVPVYTTSDPATEIEDYDSQNVIKNGGSVNHDYVTTSEFRGLNAEASSAGLGKFELQVETGVGSGTYNTVMTKFNSVSNPNVEFSHKSPKSIASGITIRIIKTNLDNQDTDMYSLINGKEQ